MLVRCLTKSSSKTFESNGNNVDWSVVRERVRSWFLKDWLDYDNLKVEGTSLDDKELIALAMKDQTQSRIFKD